MALRAPPTACCLRGRPLVLKPQKSRGRRGSLGSVGLSQSAPSRGCILPWGHQGWPEGRGIPRLESNLQSITLLSLLLHIQSLSGTTRLRTCKAKPASILGFREVVVSSEATLECSFMVKSIGRSGFEVLLLSCHMIWTGCFLS